MVKFPMVKYPMVKFPMVKYPLVKSAAPSVTAADYDPGALDYTLLFWLYCRRTPRDRGWS